MTLTEPPNGILANLLNIEGRPEMALAVNGTGPVADLRTTMTLDAGGRRALGGLATIVQQAEGFAVAADLRGPLGDLVAPSLSAVLRRRDRADGQSRWCARSGGVAISGLKLSGGQLSLEASAETTADGFLSRLNLSMQRLPIRAAHAVMLPVPGARRRSTAPR